MDDLFESAVFSVLVELMMEVSECIGFEVLHGIADLPVVVGESFSVFKEAVERETGILTELTPTTG